MNVFRLITLLVACLLLAPLTSVADDPDAIVGKWLSAKKRNQVQIYKQGNKYYGKLVWMVEPNDPLTHKPKLDQENPSETLRSRPLMNIVLLTNLTCRGNNLWDGGEIYNPEDGKTYNCDIRLKDANSIDLHGYVMGIGLLGKTRTWTRVK